MIKIKTAENTTADIAEVHAKTAADKLSKITEGYQVVSVNGVKALIPVFLSACKHVYDLIEISYGTCSDEGWEKYECSKCGDIHYESTGIDPTSHYYDYDAGTGVCLGCGELCGHFAANDEESQDAWLDENGRCIACGCYVRA